MPKYDEQILELFREEARENLSALENGFLDLERAESPKTQRPLIDALFRYAHSLKGAARAVELTDLQQAAQTLEETLDKLREHPESTDKYTIDTGLKQLDVVSKIFEHWQQQTKGRGPNDAAQPSVTPDARATSATQTRSPTEPAVERMPAAFRRPSADQPSKVDEAFTVRVPSDLLDRMLSRAAELRILQQGTAQLTAKLSALREHFISRLRELAPSKTIAAAASVTAAGETPAPQTSSIVDRQGLESALDQVRRIERELHKKWVHEDLLLGMLGDDIQQARLLPLTALAESLRRPVRDLAASLDKSIRYEIQASGILLDKAVIETLKDPLLHMVRNAADHGIETPDQRRVAGKPVEGQILLQAHRRGDRVRILICDDGRGLDFDRIRQCVKQTGELDEAEVDALSQKELVAFLFRPGFTTTQTVGEISGRGVGMDVVDDAMRRLQGTIELESSSSAGTTFAITVPVTISTVRILTVKCSGQFYGIPSSAIVRTGRVHANQLKELEGGVVLTVDGEPVPWYNLADLLMLTGRTPMASSGICSYVLVSRDGKRLAVAVDDTEDEAEVLLKPLGFPMTGIAGIVGGTIRPDGSVQIVLDVASWARRPLRTVHPVALKEPQLARRVLVVDDSPATRTVLRNVFAAAGFAVRTAADGVDALDCLRSQLADVVVADIQMPRMNGFELTRQIKAQFGLPVVLVTGLEREEDRRQGLEAGADAYVVKSTFQGAGLLEVVKQFV